MSIKLPSDKNLKYDAAVFRAVIFSLMVMIYPHFLPDDTVNKLLRALTCNAFYCIIFMQEVIVKEGH